jgi:hypothetical protein
MLAGMLLFVILGQLLTLDMSLTLYMTVVLCGLSGGATGAEEGPASWSAAGCWSRGPPLAWGCSPRAWWRRPSRRRSWCSTAPIRAIFRPWRRLHARPALPLFLAITVPVALACRARLPDFLQFFFVHEHFARYLTPSADREEVWWFFGAVFLLGSIALDAAGACGCCFTGWRRRGARGISMPRCSSRIWVWFVCVFFSLSDSKLIPYILPAMPALALLDRRRFPSAFLGAICHARRSSPSCGDRARLGAALPRAGSSPRRIAAQYFLALRRPLAEIAALLGGLGVVRAVAAPPRRDGLPCSWGWAGAWPVCCSMRAAAAVAPIYSGVTLARARSRHAARGSPLQHRARMIRRCRFIGGAPSSSCPIAASSITG